MSIQGRQNRMAKGQWLVVAKSPQAVHNLKAIQESYLSENNRNGVSVCIRMDTRAVRIFAMVARHLEPYSAHQRGPDEFVMCRNMGMGSFQKAQRNAQETFALMDWMGLGRMC
mmetsp:Transcript_7282/g.25830  ORF Transcript_7282/g.25830 Transcript_7282/m.25830 type:complete len:113 (+) Transcript_7282:789-1127(+)